VRFPRLAAALAATALLAAAVLCGAVPSAAGPAVSLADCTYKPGVELTGSPWPDARLGYRKVWSITQGKGVRVAVIDSGVNRSLPALEGVTYSDPANVLIPKDKLLNDCANHGTGVTAIIAGQSAGTPFSGVAPQATIIPIKMTDSDDNKNGAASVAAAIRAAVAVHAQVANLSVVTQAADPELRKAVEYAQAHNLILVCAGGNFGQQNNPPTYPAAWSGQYDNIIAVSATDQQDAFAPFSESGPYIDVAAPGSNVIVPYTGGGYGKQDGTSFAAPYVTGTVALMLAANRGLSPAEVRSRLEATADPPPAAVPDTKYGYGIVNPYLAVTAVQAAAPPSPSTAQAAPLPPLPVRHSSSRHLQHLALAIAAGLLGLTIVVAVAAVVARTSSSRRRPVSRVG